MTFDPNKTLTRTERQELTRKVHNHLIVSALPSHKEQVQNMVPKTDAATLGDVLNDCLKPFRTQVCGGFDTPEGLTQAVVEQRLTEEVNSFDGFICGVEASSQSLLNFKCAHRDEVVVYKRDARVSERFIHRIPTAGTQQMRLHSVDLSASGLVWIGHSSSGTRNPTKSNHNQTLFFDFISGLKTEKLHFERAESFFFGDVNFDVTDSIILDRLRHQSKALAVQFVLPKVRVMKRRFGDRPFANNQVHKDYTQNAESMIAVVPESTHIEPMDQDGLVVCRAGEIWILRQHQQPKRVQAGAEVDWVQHRAFSKAIILDHKPISCRLNGEGVLFHNFMDFRGSKGVRDVCWYDTTRLDDEERKLVGYLESKFPK